MAISDIIDATKVSATVTEQDVEAGLKTTIAAKEKPGSNGIPGNNLHTHNLPTMKLPFFNVEYDKWGPFNERSCCLVDEDDNTPTNIQVWLFA